MAQFDVYRLAGGELAIDVQTTLISDFNSRGGDPPVAAA